MITEMLQDPSGDESVKEWFEIYNPTNADVSLLQWRIGRRKPAC